MQFLKTINRRLNDNTIINIKEYKNELGGKTHQVKLYYEDTKQTIDFGILSLSSSFLGTSGCDRYSYNENYIIIWKYNSDDDMLDLKNVFDIKERKEMLSDNEFGNYYASVVAENNIASFKHKGKKLRNYNLG